MPDKPPNTEQLKVVAHAVDGRLFKGFLDREIEHLASVEEVPRPTLLPTQLNLRSIDGKVHSVTVPELKALFFVRSFEGSKQYSETKFFSSHPILEGIWARLHFNDNETIEGLIYNSLHFLTTDGFFLKPPDPQSNNRFMYVVKASLRDFRIMGVRNTY